MNKRNLPEIAAAFGADADRDDVDFELTKAALQRWNPALRAEASADPSSTEISVFGVIGETWDGSGITARRIAGIIRAAGENAALTVNINSPGGNAFEGIAIYNQLRAHKGDVTVNVLGIAASAASIIAMAGDTVQMGQAAFLMIHNVLLLAIGNRNDLRDAANKMEPIDRALADLYAARTGMDAKAVAKLMDAETWFGATDAIDQGFADGLMPENRIRQESGDAGKATARARAELDNVLAKAGYSRGRRRELLKEFKAAMPGAGASMEDGMPCAAEPQPHQPILNEENMDIAKLRAEHPALAEQLLAEGREAGAAAERARIQGVEAQSLPGHGELIAKLKYDGKTTAGDAAAQILAAERAKLGAKANDLQADAAAVAAAAPSVAATGAVGKTGEDKPAPAITGPITEAEARAEWDKDASVRAEFGNRFEEYFAIRKAETTGRDKVLGKKAA